jgi:hypothetical protein
MFNQLTHLSLIFLDGRGASGRKVIRGCKGTMHHLEDFA